MSLMDDYFAALLADPEVKGAPQPAPAVKADDKPGRPLAERPAPTSDDKAALTKLLAQVRTAQAEEEAAKVAVEAKAEAPAPVAPPAPVDVVKAPPAPAQEVPAEPAAAIAAEAKAEPVRPEGSFQVLLFDVDGLELAVPLDSLGGIHQLTEVSPLFGKPDWFKGIMLHRNQKIRVVDTARWVMPDKIKHQENDQNYRYLVMLGDSPWGLACQSLVRTEKIDSASVRWRQGASKRPWLAGMVKERMCALLDVEALLGMLDKGLGGLDLEDNKGKA
ncbi:chemotaxis protein CheW [Gallaecimonas xiamenensis]|uniref:CheW protein n=1 Tax=Gallaecimonas xiamenensis 3-C-1 TaxID=745411 RepID=K2KDK7_9GAMM|nr:chemotaxis protein CheW [Gallaecimonas xiamenensis]EKE75395.1 CheW protein [Gallaecimonas xiamenensis 3-C-1]